MDKLVTIYFFAINVLAFVLMGVDKYKAIRRRWRIPEATLFAVAVLGGGMGGTLGMISFRHKTRHWYFKVFFPLLAAAELALYILLQN